MTYYVIKHDHLTTPVCYDYDFEGFLYYEVMLMCIYFLVTSMQVRMVEIFVVPCQ